MDRGERGVHNSCTICSPLSCTRGKVQRKKKPRHLYSLKKGAGMLNKEEIELLFHSLNTEMFVQLKEKHSEGLERL